VREVVIGAVRGAAKGAVSGAAEAGSKASGIGQSDQGKKPKAKRK
jgi:hypothetical protein